MDPTRRFLRYPILLGRGACKRVYKGMQGVPSQCLKLSFAFASSVWCTKQQVQTTADACHSAKVFASNSAPPTACLALWERLTP